jgi:ATP-dependent RNA helicase DeaD
LTNFKELNLSNEILQALDEMEFSVASPIQSKAIPILQTGKDIIGQAETGTGKTAAFAIPSIQLIDPSSLSTQILVLCPTRELVIQVAGEFTKLTKFIPEIKILPIYGGQNISIQLKALKGQAHVVIGTAGRILDHLRRNTLKLDKVKMVILDEADQMLDMGFREDLYFIL